MGGLKNTVCDVKEHVRKEKDIMVEEEIRLRKEEIPLDECEETLEGYGIKYGDTLDMIKPAETAQTVEEDELISRAQVFGGIIAGAVFILLLAVIFLAAIAVPPKPL